MYNNTLSNTWNLDTSSITLPSTSSITLPSSREFYFTLTEPSISINPSLWRELLCDKKPIQPIRIDTNGDYTTVHWNDGTHTPVKRAEDEKDNLYAAFCAALAKKLYGSTAAVHRLVESVDVKHVEAKKEAERKARLKAQAEKERREHERKLKVLAKKLALQKEVEAYYREHYPEP